MTDVVNFPIKTWQRIKNKRGKFSVSCNVSDRWFRFHSPASTIGGETPLFVDVMTDASGHGKKICELCVNVEDLRRVLDNYEIANAKRPR